MNATSDCLLAVLITGLLPVLFLCMIYIFDWGSQSRDDPVSIQRRLKGVSVACGISILISYKWTDAHCIHMFLAQFGLDIWSVSYWTAIGKNLLLTATLFLGPIVGSFILAGANAFLQFTTPAYWSSCAGSPTWLRNHVFAPITEEIVFRACAVPVLFTCHTLSPGSVCLLAPVWFSLAHYHHIVERSRDGTGFGEAFMQCSFQAAFTYLFGIYATWLFVHNTNLISVIAVHAFCNHMGFPDVALLTELRGWRRALLAISYAGGVVGFAFGIANSA